MMSTLDEWRVAYATQALADLAARDVLLAQPGLPECQQLHFLQMACEKVCKAYLCGQGTDPEQLLTSHAYISGPLPVIARQQLAQRGRGFSDQGWIIRGIRALARQIELLAPAVREAGSSPSNCEYPWADASGAVHTPSEHRFNLDLSRDRAGRYLLQVVYSAATSLAIPDGKSARASIDP